MLALPNKSYELLVNNDDGQAFDLTTPIRCLLLFTACSTLNETPHYLLTHNRHDEAEKLFKSMARMNGRQLPEVAMESLKEDEEEALTEKVKDIFKAPVLLKRTAIFIYLW